MQTFMPFDTFYQSIYCLDQKRLGKQRVEAKQILDILLNRTNKKGWRNHPAVKMWKGYEDALKIYYNICLSRWEQLNYKNKMKYESTNLEKQNCEYPHWMGNKDFHNSHRSNLLRKDFEHYKQFGWELKVNLPYIWPKGKEE